MKEEWRRNNEAGENEIVGRRGLGDGDMPNLRGQCTGRGRSMRRMEDAQLGKDMTRDTVVGSGSGVASDALEMGLGSITGLQSSTMNNCGTKEGMMLSDVGNDPGADRLPIGDRRGLSMTIRSICIVLGMSDDFRCFQKIDALHGASFFPALLTVTLTRKCIPFSTDFLKCPRDLVRLTSKARSQADVDR